MNKTRDQQAQEYAEKKLRTTFPNMTLSRIDKVVDLFDTYDIQQAYSDGYTAAEQSMWRSVEEELPEDGQNIVFYYRKNSILGGGLERDMATVKYRSDIGFSVWETNTHTKVLVWMPIPPIPDTNTEKK